MWCLLLSVAAFVAVAMLPALPSQGLSLTLLLLNSLALMLASLCWQRGRPRGLLLIRSLLVLWFACWAMNWGSWQLATRLPPPLEGVDITVEGIVDGLVSEAGNADDRHIQRFDFRVHRVYLAGAWHSVNALSGLPVLQGQRFPRRLRLSVYHGSKVSGGEGWQWVVRLKRPHGFANPGGFDYERWLLSRGLGATGYVRRSAENELSSWKRLPEIDDPLQRWRSTMKVRIGSLLGQDRSAAVIQALALGERSQLDDISTDRIQQLGLSHLLAISGLHIGLAGACGWWLGRTLGGFLAIGLPHRLAGPNLGWLMSVAVAIGYGSLAGFSLATQRALIMLLVAAIWYLGGRRYSAWLGWWLSMLIVLCLQPLAILEAGFWFSFLAVAVLMVSLAVPATHWRARLWQLCKVQLGLFVFVGGLQLFWGMPVSALSPLANWLAIPYISVLAVPLILLALALNLLSDGLTGSFDGGMIGSLADKVWLLSGLFLDGFWWMLDQLASLPAWLLLKPWQSIAPAALLLALLGFALLLLPFNRWSRVLGLMMASTLIWPVVGTDWLPAEDRGKRTIQLTVLDVGQGLAVVAGDGKEWLLYDTGPRYSEHFNAGEAILLPFMRNKAIERFRWGVISHWDTDHSGGFPALSGQGKVVRWLMSEARGSQLDRACEPGSWQVGAWQVEVLGAGSGQGNNESCVLLLQSRGIRVLLPGDIEREREAALLLHPALQTPVDILLAPHHGSITSSTPGFVTQLSPRWVVFSAGYRNRYRHPHPIVVERYRRSQARLFMTAEEGAVHFQINADDEENADVAVSSYRRRSPGYWRRSLIQEN